MAKGSGGTKDIITRMQELYVYDLYGFRTETKALASVLYPYETINCFATGIYAGRRRMLVVTIYRIIIVASNLVSPADIITIRREAITQHAFHKRFFTSSIEFSTAEEHYELKNVSRRILEMFSWAVEQPLPQS